MIMLAALSFEQSALLLAWVAIVLLALAMSGLLRQVHALTEALQGGRRTAVGPAAGTVVPKLAGLDGVARSLLLFVEPACPACDRALERLVTAARNGSDSVGYLVVYRGDATAVQDTAVTTITHADRVFSDLGVTVTPTAVALDERRTVIASAPVGSPELVEQFLDYVTRGQEMRDENH